MIVASAAGISIISFHYRYYVFAIAWHGIHGNYAEVGGHRVKLPLLWWAEDDAYRYDTRLLLRADTYNLVGSEIAIGPALLGSVRDTDVDELKAVELLITTTTRTKNSGVSSSLVVIRTKPFAAYCEKTEFSPFDIPVANNLYCIAPKFPYQLVYSGRSVHENEAESILSTLN